MIAKVSSALSVIEKQGGGILLFVSTLLIMAQIVMRAVFGFAISGIYELATFCVIWSVILTVGLGIRNNVHVRVDILMRIVPLRIARTMEYLVCMVVAVIGGALIYSGILLVQESPAFGDATLGTIRIPMWMPQSIMPLGGLFIVVHTVGRIVGLWRRTIPLFDDHDIAPSA
ncbi:MAG: TRAP transporter small permease [Roseovarius sp.]|nr:TRAP transporter small permease [Roseovarius sp.]